MDFVRRIDGGGDSVGGDARYLDRDGSGGFVSGVELATELGVAGTGGDRCRIFRIACGIEGALHLDLQAQRCRLQSVPRGDVADRYRDDQTASCAWPGAGRRENTI